MNTAPTAANYCELHKRFKRHPEGNTLIPRVCNVCAFLERHPAVAK